jgi:ribosomal protein S25
MKLKLVKNGNTIEHGANSVKKYMLSGQGIANPDLLTRPSLTGNMYISPCEIMSIPLLLAVWKIQNITQLEQHVLLALADYVNVDDVNTCYPSMTKIAAKCRIAIRTARKTIASLEKKNIVIRQQFTGRSTTYCLNITPAQYADQNGTIDRHNLPSTGGDKKSEEIHMNDAHGKCIVCDRLGCNRVKGSTWRYA